MHDAPRFHYLNRESRWAGFHFSGGLAVGDDGALRLAHLPRLVDAPPPGLAALSKPTAPGGIAAGPDDTAYYADAGGHRVLRIDGCHPDGAPLACIGGPGDLPGRVHAPRGLVYLPQRRALVVADSLNHRLQLFDVDTQQLVAVWGEHGDRDGQFRTPLSVAVDRGGNVYVADQSTPRVQKLDPDGRVDPGFWTAARAGLTANGEGLRRPAAVAVAARPSGDVVFVLDSAARRICAFGVAGDFVGAFDVAAAGDGGDGETASLPVEPMGVAAGSDKIYVGDNAGRQVLCFLDDGTSVGAAMGYNGPIAALALGGGQLYVQPGPDRPLVALAARGGHASDGQAWGGPFANTSFHKEQWHWLTSELERPPGTHVELLVYRAPAGSGGAGPTPAATGQTSPGPRIAPWQRADAAETLLDVIRRMETGQPAAFPPRWTRMPPDVAEGLVPGGPAENVWIGIAMMGDGAGTPALSQVRLEFDHRTWLPYLPAVYQDDDRSRHFLARFLTLFESLFAEAEHGIDGLPRLFDADAVPAPALSWLGSWLGLDVHEDWPESVQRRAIAEAMALSGLRGTAEGLRRAIALQAGVNVRIEEPILTAQWWSLAPSADAPPADAEGSVLGLTTMLAPAAPQGAIVGATATLGGSHLIAGDQAGEPLFTDVAHQFAVLMYRGAAYSVAAEAAVRAVIAREQPAHTTYQLCVVEPAMRLGWQARIGIDSIVAGRAPITPLGEAAPLGAGMAIGGSPSGRIGQHSRIGRSTRLG